MKRNLSCAARRLSSAICCSFLLHSVSYAATPGTPGSAGTPNWVTVGEDAHVRASIDRNSIQNQGDARAFALRYYLLGGMEPGAAFPDNPTTFEALYSCNERWRTIVYSKTKTTKNGVNANAYSQASHFAPGTLDDKIRQAVCK